MKMQNLTAIVEPIIKIRQALDLMCKNGAKFV